MTHATAYAIPEFTASAIATMGGMPAVLPEDSPERIGLGRDPRTARSAAKRRYVRLLREQKAAEHIGELPGPMEDIVLMLTGTFHGWDILTAILDLAATHAEEVYVATLGFNRVQTRTLAALLDTGRIGRMTFVLSEMFTAKNPAEYQYLADTLTSRGHRIANTRNHAKLMLIKLADSRHIVTHGSLNLRRCNSFEQIVITQDAELYRFFAEFLEDVIRGEVAA